MYDNHAGDYMKVRTRFLLAGIVPVIVMTIIFCIIVIQETSNASIITNAMKIYIPLLLVCMAVVVVLSRLTVKAIEEEAKLINKMADGNLKFDFKDETVKKDEISRIRHAIVKLQGELVDLLKTMNTDAERLKMDSSDFSSKFNTIQDSVSAINIAVQEIAEGNTVLAQEATAEAEQINHMSMSIDNNIKSIKTLDESVKNMTQFADFVKNILDELEDISDKVTENMVAVTNKTLETNESAEKIHEVVQMIQGISAQTNLLSLNASIEAARAGEAGRGFSVVAGEIMKLAKESSDNAAQISEIVSELSQNSLENVDMIHEVDEISKVQKNKLDETLNAFNDLEKEVTAVDDASHVISDSIDELNSQKVAINSSIEQLAAVSQQNAASTEQTSASMHEVTDILELLVEESKDLKKISEDIHNQTELFVY